MDTAEPSSFLTISRPELLQNGSDGAFRQLIQDMLSLSVRLQAIRDKFGAVAGISGPQYSIMIAVAHMERAAIPVTVGGLGAHLHVSGTFITAESKKLERAGLLRKQPNPIDRRSVILSLTDHGHTLIDSVRHIVRAGNDTIFRELSQDDFNALRRMMAGMVDAVGDALVLTEANRQKRVGKPAP